VDDLGSTRGAVALSGAGARLYTPRVSPTSGASLADLADLLGECAFAWEAEAGLALHGATWLGLAGPPEVAGAALLRSLDEPDRRALDEALRRPQAVDLQLRHAAPGGTVRWLRVRVRAAGREGARRVGTIADVTEAHELERELRASEERFRRIVTSCVEGVAILDARACCTYANPQLAALLGEPSPEACLGRRPRDYTTPDAAADLERRIARRRPGDADRYEIALHRRDGREIMVEVSTSTVAAADGGPSGFVALFRDVTEQRAVEEQVREGQKLESLGVLAGGVAHEFNNLLAGVLANTGFALSELPQESDLRSALEDARSAAQRASALTRQLLAYSGRGKLAVGPADLNRVVREMGSLAAPVLSRRGRLSWQLGEGLPDVEGDAGQLGQVVMNLLTNASDALGDRDGLIEVRTALGTFDAAALAAFHGAEGLPEGRYLVLEVSDGGAGMDGATRLRIFEPFFTTKFTGRGLGMPAVLGIVRSHRGAIRVESELGRGTRVTVLLPPRAAPPADEAPPRQASPAEGRCILVADDEEVVRRAARRALERVGYEVVEAADGVDAVERFNAEPGRFRCVLLDMTMPGLTGDRVLEAVRGVRPGLPAVLMSGFLEIDDLPPQLAPLAFLPKPFGQSDLVAAVERALGGGG